MSKICIIHQSPVIRRGLTSILSEARTWKITEEAEITQSMNAVIRLRPDLIITDFPLRALHELSPKLPKAAILGFLDKPDVYFYYGLKAVHSGAKGCIFATQEPEEILSAIRLVLKGEVYLPPPMQQVIFRGIDRSNPAFVLSNRQVVIFRLLGFGLTSAEVAKRLKLSIKTVETHREIIKRKLNLPNATALQMRAFEFVRSEDMFSSGSPEKPKA